MNDLESRPWPTDGSTKLPSSAIHSHDKLTPKGEQLTAEVISWPKYQIEELKDIDFYRLYDFSGMNSDLLDALAAQPWYSDSLNGGEFAFPEIDYVDDNDASEPSDAPLVEVGEVVTGSLDHNFDFDYFQFRAEQGQRYRLGVEYESLGHGSITTYSPEGMSEERDTWKSRNNGIGGPFILWMAPNSEDYNFAVQNFGGKTGAYTFTIESIDVMHADDHGDLPENATAYCEIWAPWESVVKDTQSNGWRRTPTNTIYPFTASRIEWVTMNSRFQINPALILRVDLVP